eukprot:CAMPEP_0198543798 /NCGR_PEP_ID=MMETSP1462-20131121/59857_1 /TAXON_ID=1333877 /ORGANISM="Brandtodinium nutriculum, Strain RCC3387" /LENGTH=166 /DNA_ID=CAMNT_0044274091 /DNA_START=13 /DNA_END=510 /DNA_ORIENTATION=+
MGHPHPCRGRFDRAEKGRALKGIAPRSARDAPADPQSEHLASLAKTQKLPAVADKAVHLHNAIALDDLELGVQVVPALCKPSADLVDPQRANLGTWVHVEAELHWRVADALVQLDDEFVRLARRAALFAGGAHAQQSTTRSAAAWQKPPAGHPRGACSGDREGAAR